MSEKENPIMVSSGIDSEKKSATLNSSRSLSLSSQVSKPKAILETPVDEAAALEKASEEPEYPSGVKLAIITLSLCLAVFCMALVRPLHLPRVLVEVMRVHC